jgi:fatty acid desaturase
VEHHLFPGLNSDYYPLLRQLLIARHGERYQLLPAGKAWRLLLSTPRHYRDSHTLVGWDGEDGTTISANHHS